MGVTFWDESVNFWDEDVNFWDKGVIFWDKGVNFWDEGVNFWDKGVNFLDEGVNFLDEGVNFLDEGVMSIFWTRVSICCVNFWDEGVNFGSFWIIPFGLFLDNSFGIVPLESFLWGVGELEWSHMTPLGFEPVHFALVELESTPLDHSGKVSAAWKVQTSRTVFFPLGSFLWDRAFGIVPLDRSFGFFFAPCC